MDTFGGSPGQYRVVRSKCHSSSGSIARDDALISCFTLCLLLLLPLTGFCVHMDESDFVASFKREDFTASRTASGKGRFKTDAEDDLLRVATTARANGIRRDGVVRLLNLRDTDLLIDKVDMACIQRMELRVFKSPRVHYNSIDEDEEQMPMNSRMLTASVAAERKAARPRPKHVMSSLLSAKALL